MRIHYIRGGRALRVYFVPGSSEVSLRQVKSRLDGIALYEPAHMKPVNDQTTTEDSRYKIGDQYVPIRIVCPRPGCADQFIREIGSLVEEREIEVVFQAA